MILLSSVPGISLLLLNVTARATSCTNALVALALRLMTHATPLLTDTASAVPIWTMPDISLLTPAVNSQMPLPPGLAAGRFSMSAVSAFCVICTFSLPPFQLASPSGSLMTMLLATFTGVCSVTEVTTPGETLETVGASFTGVTLTVA